MQLESVDAPEQNVERVLQRTVRRVRAQGALVAATYAASAAGLGLLLVALASRFMAPRAAFGWSAALLAALPLLAAVARALLRVDPAGAARRLDRAHGLHDTIQAALEVSALPAARRSAFGAALLREAEALAPRLSPVRAAPLHVPRATLVAAALAALSLFVWQLPARPEHAPPGGDLQTAPSSGAAPPRMGAQPTDELEGEQPGTDPRQREIVRALRTGEISREQAIGALLSLERELRHADAEQLLRGELLDRLAELLDGPRGQGPRKLERAAEVLRDPESTPEEREQQRRLIEEKRRELDRLRSARAKSAAERRELEQLSRHMNDAAKALAAGRPEQAAAQLDAAAQRARKQLAGREQREQGPGAAEAAAQQRELLQRRRAEAGRPGQGGRERGQLQRENEQRFAEHAEQGQQLVPAAGGGSGDPSASSPEPSLLGGEPRPNVGLKDHAAQSAQGDGPSRSEVVMSAADRGFADESYRKVYADYRKHAEAVLEHDRVPSGYRYYVRRYFQLIRPRAGASP